MTNDRISSLSRRDLLLRTAAGAGALAVGGGLLAACGGSESGSGSASAIAEAATTAAADTATASGAVSTDKISISWIPAICEVPTWAAYHNGFFEEAGLNVELVQLAEGRYDALSTGKITAAPAIMYQMLKPIEQGLNIKLASTLHKGCLRFVVRKDSGIETLEQVKGKTIITDEINGAAMTFFSLDLAKAGINPEKDVQWKAVPFDQVPQALAKGEGDVATAPDPAAYFPLQDGSAFELLSNMKNDHVENNCCVVTLNGDFAQNDPVTATALVDAWQRGSEWVGLNVEAAAEIAVNEKYTAAPLPLVTALLSEYIWTPNSKNLQAEFQAGAEAFSKTGYLSSGTDPVALAEAAYVSLPDLKV